MMRPRVHFGNSNRSGLLAIGVLGLLLFMMGSDGYADLIVSNMAGDDGVNFGGTGIYAQSFTTDAQLYRLDNIRLRVATWQYSDGTSASGIEVEIRDNNVGSTPSAVVGSFNIPLLPFEEWADTTFLPSTDVFLNPLTTYWITTTHSSVHDGAFQFRGTAAAAVGPGTMGSQLLCSDDGGLSWHSASSQDMKLEVNGTIVPAPAAVILGILGLSAAATRLRRRRNLK